MSFWNHYTELEKKKEKENKFETYLAKRNFIVKKIPFSNDEEKGIKLGIIELIKTEMRIYDIYEDESDIFVVLDSDEKTSKLFDENYAKLNSVGFKEEAIIKGNGKYSNLFEIQKIYDKCKSKVPKIEFILNGNKIKGSSFILELDDKLGLPFKKALFTCNHIINEEYLIKNEDINIKINDKESTWINIKDSNIYTVNCFDPNTNPNNSKKRKIFTESFLFDFTCIEILKTDKIYKNESFKVDNDYSMDDLKPKDIVLLHYPFGEDLSFSIGQILKIEDNKILHFASTEKGSSGCPIISRDNLSVIGMHYGGSSINYGFLLKDILSYIKYIYDNLFILKQNLIKDMSLIKYDKYDNDSTKVKKKIKLREGKVGIIYEAINKENCDEKFLMVEVNLIKYYSKFGFEKIKKDLWKGDYVRGNNIIIVNERIYQKTLCEYIKDKNYVFEKKKIQNLLLQLIDYLHENIFVGIISPENILISDNKYKFIFNYDYDKLILGEYDKHFVAPEIMDRIDMYENNNNLYYNPKFHLWSIGILIYYLIKRKFPFESYKPEKILQEIEKNKKEKGKNWLDLDLDLDSNFYITRLIENESNRITWNEFYLKFKLGCFSLSADEHNILENKKSSICLVEHNRRKIKCNCHKCNGFFCQVNYKNFPFKKCLFFHYDNDKEINISFLKDDKIIKKNIILNNRKFIKYKDFSCIELFENDDISDYFIVDENAMKNKDDHNHEIFLFQYNMCNNNFYYLLGQITDRNEEIYEHNVQTLEGALGSPIVLRENINYIIAIHEGCYKSNKLKKRAYSINYILDNMLLHFK